MLLSQHPQGRAGRATGDTRGHYKSPGLTPCPPPSQFRQVGGSSALQRAALASDAAGGTLDGRGVSECHAPGGGDSSIPVWGCPRGPLPGRGLVIISTGDTWSLSCELASRFSPGLEPGLGAPAAPGCGVGTCRHTGGRSPGLGLSVSAPCYRRPLPSEGGHSGHKYEYSAGPTREPAEAKNPQQLPHRGRCLGDWDP